MSPPAAPNEAPPPSTELVRSSEAESAVVVIQLIDDEIQLSGERVADAQALQQRLMATSGFTTLLQIEQRGETSNETLWGVLREVSRVPARRVELKLPELSFAFSSRLAPPSTTPSKLLSGSVREGVLVVKVDSEITRVKVGDTAAETRARAAVDRECENASCGGILWLNGDVPLPPILRSWQRVFGDREQSLSIGPFGEPVEDVAARPGRKIGRLAPEIIQRVVRENFWSMRDCYQSGLARNRKLAGLVEVRFAIDAEGAATKVEDYGSNLPDPTVLRCVLEVFEKLRFPPPEGGIVTVVYPVMLQPD